MEATTASHPPRVTVVIPACNEEQNLGRCLDALLAQTYPSELLDVVVAIGPSTDRTEAVAARFATDTGRVTVVRTSRWETPIVFNAGLARATGEVIGRIDAHAFVDTDFVAVGVETLRATGADGVGGVAQFTGRSRQGQAIALAMNSRLGAGPASFRVGGEERVTDTLMFGLYPAATWERTGAYDETLTRNQDDEWHHRVRRGGGRLVFTPRMRFDHAARESLGALARQYHGWGRFRARTIAKHRAVGSPRQLVPAVLVGTLVGSAMLGRRPSAVVVGCYAVGVAAAGTQLAAAHADRELAPRVALAMATMHLAYGAGMWRGLADGIAPRRAPAGDGSAT